MQCAPRGPINNISLIGSDNDLVPTRQQTIFWTKDGFITATYRKVSNIRPTKSQNLNASRLTL